jgi:hypothetical protein
VSKDEAAAVIAYILKLNKIPAGKVELSTERDALDRIGIGCAAAALMPSGAFRGESEKD